MSWRHVPVLLSVSFNMPLPSTIPLPLSLSPDTSALPLPEYKKAVTAYCHPWQHVKMRSTIHIPNCTRIPVMLSVSFNMLVLPSTIPLPLPLSLSPDTDELPLPVKRRIQVKELWITMLENYDKEGNFDKTKPWVHIIPVVFNVSLEVLVSSTISIPLPLPLSPDAGELPLPVRKFEATQSHTVVLS